MAKATTTLRQVLNYEPDHGAWFAANHALFNRVASFYFDVIQAHEKVLDLSNKEALTALEMLTHTTQSNPNPIMPLEDLAEDLPAMFRRAAINAALGSARSFYSHLSTWRKRKEKAEAKGKKFHERPPVPPRTWNKSATLYAGQWKQRTGSSILLKVWTGTCWSWTKVRITGRELPDSVDAGSPQLVRRGNQWWLHTPIEKTFKSPPKIEKQVTTNAQTKICAVDLNIHEHLAVCTIQTVEGSILATTFIGDGRRISGFRKKLLGRIARNRGKTGMIAENEQDNADLWRKMNNVDEHIAHLLSARIVQFAKQHDATTGAPLVACTQCGMKGNADRNASLVIGQRLVERYHKPSQGKPPTPLHAERAEKSAGVEVCQDAKSVGTQPSTGSARHAALNEHGTTQDMSLGMDKHISDIPCQLRFSF